MLLAKRVSYMAAVALMIVATAAPALAHSWNHGSCTFGGDNGFLGGNQAWSKTTEMSYPSTTCDGLAAGIQYKVDGYWYWTANVWNWSNPSSKTTLVNGADDHGSSRHIAEAGQNTFDLSPTKTHS